MKAEGWCWFYGAVNHRASDAAGWHVAKKGDRWAVLEPVRQGVRAHMGGFGKSIALGLGLRHDWGWQHRARQFQAEIKCLGQSRDRNLHRALQQRLASSAARVHDPGPCPREAQQKGRRDV